MEEKFVKPNEIVQLSPECRNPMFACCLLVVTEVRKRGVMGYVLALGENGEPGGRAYYIAEWDEFEPTGGTVQWVPKESE